VLLPLDFLERHGTHFPAWRLKDSRRYTRALTKAHYENFTVAGLLVARHLRQDYCNIYAYCRWADDLGDETGDPSQSLELLEWWREQLLAMDAGQAHHPVFVALLDTSLRHSLPRGEFEDLLHAFVRDQSVRRYRTYAELLDYCRFSANPVGRLVLRLNGYRNESLFALSDAICTALQLANHWQDVKRDWAMNRVYLPDEVMRSHGYSVDTLRRDINSRNASAGFRSTLRDLCLRARDLFHAGLPLANRVNGRLAIEIELYASAGMAVLDEIEAQGWDTVSRRPIIGKRARATLLVGAFLRRLLGASRTGSEAPNAHG
jgi:squalene synthase HpnC